MTNPEGRKALLPLLYRARNCGGACPHCREALDQAIEVALAVKVEALRLVNLVERCEGAGPWHEGFAAGWESAMAQGEPGKTLEELDAEIEGRS